MNGPPSTAYIDGDELVFTMTATCPSPYPLQRLVVPVIRNAESLSMADIDNEGRRTRHQGPRQQALHGRDAGRHLHHPNGGVSAADVHSHHQHSPIRHPRMQQDRRAPCRSEWAGRRPPHDVLAVSYDHRIIDGRESVSFLVRIKELLENPDQLLFGTDPLKALLEL